MRARDYGRVRVLLVEDDPGDQELTRRALTGEIAPVDLRIVSDGEQAMDYLLRRGRFADPEMSPEPDLILLDLNLPRLDGGEVLRLMQRDPKLRRIPVVVLTTSRQEADIVRSYGLGCNSFINKPVDLEEFMDQIRAMESYWFKLVALPAVGRRGNA